MIRSADQTSPEQYPLYDLCIIGSGPAGMTICNELSDTNLRICVLESGNRAKSSFADDLRVVESDGLSIAEDSLERMVGGTSQTWFGLSAPLDPIDFSPRPFPHHIGWPISRADLDPWYERAKRFNFPPLSHFHPDIFSDAGDTGKSRFHWKNCEEKVFLLPTYPLRFGTEYQHAYQQSPNIDLITDATVTRLASEAASGTIRSHVTVAACKTPKGMEVSIRAKVFVLAAGTIENARILLNSTSTSPNGLGNEHDQVGRYLMNHPKVWAGRVSLNAPIKELRNYAWRLYPDGAGYVGVRLREEVQTRLGLLNCYVQVTPHFPWTNRQETASFRSLFAVLWRTELTTWIRDLAKHNISGVARKWHLVRRAIWAAVRDSPGLLRLILIRALRGRHPLTPTVGFFNYIEMEPNPENRVTLGKERDAFGVRVPHVRHVRSDRDMKSLFALHEFLAQEFAGFGMGGSLCSTFADIESNVTVDAFHYLGTTRMGSDPKTSVVNSDLRVHSVRNLYVAGGAVFPTSGCANPTMTIVALSIRLADHLRRYPFD
ncbi:MAG: hypothetical protein HW407_1324 [Bacteroidetes bacterium]|nr:hypothetical protein [Bacteroidota bacterium]